MNKEMHGRVFFVSMIEECLSSTNQLNTDNIEIILRYSDTSWFKSKTFLHFTPRIPKYSGKGGNKKINIKSYDRLLRYVASPKLVARHRFYPLIHYAIKERRYATNLKKQSSRGIKIKSRHINYATHIDTHIYSYYAKTILGELYEKLVSAKPYNSSIIAYRQIPKSINKGEYKYKSNIDFAHEAFTYIDSLDESIVLILDIKNFFDTIDHNRLYQAWANLLGIENKRLPEDHYLLYKSLTNYSFVEESDILTSLNLSKSKLRKKPSKSYFDSPQEFRKEIVHKKLIRTTDNKKGIPQGTSLSAFLSNLYLLDFDSKLYDFGNQNAKFFFYRRYSDDMLIVCPKNNYEEILKYIEKVLDEEFKVQIHSGKTVIASVFKNEMGDSVIQTEDGKKAVQYLGFNFDGQVVSLKEQGLSKFYRRMKKAVRYKAHRAGMRSEKDILKSFQPRNIANKSQFKDKGIFTNKLYRRFSLMSKNNYLGYSIRSAKEFKDMKNVIRQQISNAWKNLQNEIKKYNYYDDTDEEDGIDFDFF
ncbi:MAG: hypothetical protein ACJAWV_001549 [Flammeovirgaceae bacterium]|jgi:hypothetical protein